MTVADVINLTLIEKLRTMEAIWSDLRSHIDDADIPETHRQLIDERRKRVESGEASLQSWDNIKHSIGRS